MRPSVVILTFNSEATIENTLRSITSISDDIHVVDSYSTDGTLRIVERFTNSIVQRPFENYGKQRNWSIEHLPIRSEWELHLDSDERVSEVLAKEILDFREATIGKINGFHIARLVHFMGGPIKHGGMYPIWHLRLFRRRLGRCEDRLYDQHFYVQGETSRLKGEMIDDIKSSLSEWTSRHNRWADAEAKELLEMDKRGRIVPNLYGTPIEKKRYLRRIYENLPLFSRAFLLFIYRYICRLGFLDGRRGLVFFVLQTFWFRFLVDAKIYEHRIVSPAPRQQ